MSGLVLGTASSNIYVALADRRARLLWANTFPDQSLLDSEKPFFDFIHPDDLQRVKDAFARCVIHGEIVDLSIRALHYSPQSTELTYSTYQARYYPCDIQHAPHVAAVIVSHVVPSGVELSDTDREVLKGLMDDKTIKEIADHLDKSQSTIDSRVKTLKDKLGVQTLPGLVASAMRSYLG